MDIPDPTKASREEVRAVLAALETQLQNLPHSLPLVHSDKSAFTEFTRRPFPLDPQKLEHTGCEVATLGEHLELAFGWKSRTSGDGILKISERGEAIAAVHSVLDEFFTKYPENNTLKKWIIDVARGVQATAQGDGKVSLSFRNA
jgi:hypothetical protein